MAWLAALMPAAGAAGAAGATGAASAAPALSAAAAPTAFEGGAAMFAPATGGGSAPMLSAGNLPTGGGFMDNVIQGVDMYKGAKEQYNKALDPFKQFAVDLKEEKLQPLSNQSVSLPQVSNAAYLSKYRPNGFRY